MWKWILLSLCIFATVNWFISPIIFNNTLEISILYSIGCAGFIMILSFLFKD